MPTEEFEKKFKYLIDDPPIKETKLKEIHKAKSEKKN